MSDKVISRSFDRLPNQASIGLALAFNPGYETVAAQRFRELAQRLSNLQDADLVD